MTSPDEIHAIPHPLSVASTLSSFDSPEFAADFDISGIKFISAASDVYPYQRELTKVLKDQVDTSTVPGDNSLQGWWTRSQTDWSGGSGQEYMEPISEDIVRRKFFDSAGVDVFTRPGFFSLLPKTRERNRAAGVSGRVAKVPDGFVYALGSMLHKIPSDDLEAGIEVHEGEDVQSLVMAGPNLIVGYADKATVVDDSFDPIATISGFTGESTMSWVKGRLMFSAGDKVWELPGHITEDVDLSDTDTYPPKVDMKDPSWVFVGAASTPSAILLAGHGNSGSAILSLQLDVSGSLPDLTAPIEVAQFPISETLIGIASYLGTFLGLLTDKGVRVGTVTDSGGLVYGPLIGSPASTGSGKDISVFDRFMAYPVQDAGDGRGGMVLVDLSVSDADDRNAWANWTRVPSNATVIDAVILDKDSTAMVALEPASGGTFEVVLYEANPLYGLEDEGWLTTSWVRFGTLEPKYYDQVKVVCDPPMAGSVLVSYLDDETTEVSLGALTGSVGQEAVFKVSGRAGFTDMALKFRLRPDAEDTSKGPDVAAWSMRAWPAVYDRGETVYLTLLCFDFERDSRGVQVGYEGYARERWEALVEQLNSGAAVRVKEEAGGFAYMAIGEDASFIQVSPPTGASGFGGVAKVTLRQA